MSLKMPSVYPKYVHLILESWTKDENPNLFDQIILVNKINQTIKKIVGLLRNLFLLGENLFN